MTQLDKLRPGERGRIVDIHGDDAIAIRLMEMGLVDGEEIAVMGYAPLGDPVECRVRDYRISLRLAEAKRVEVERIPSTESQTSAPSGETT